MSRWKSHLILHIAALSFRQSECLCLTHTQVMKISSNSMDGFIHCYSGWRSTTMQVLNTSVNMSCSQPCILMRRPRPGLTVMSKASTVGDGRGPSKMSSQDCMINSYMSHPFRTLHRSSILWSTPWMVVYLDSIMNSNATRRGWYTSLIHICSTPTNDGVTV